VSEAEPVSWFLVEQGWTVGAADGAEVGKVEEVVGDSSRDIFNGLTIGTGLLHRARYVPAELVAELREGRVRLTITADEVERLDHYEEPPPSGEIRAD
jgi:uncharacterized protein YrrD